MIAFERDKTKANLTKHGISFEEAKSAFFDECAVQFYDDSHSQIEEDRFLLPGMSNLSNVLPVSTDGVQRNPG